MYKTTSKVCIKISNNVDRLLNGITANTLDKSQNAFLDRFGKLIALVEQLRIGNDIYFLVEEQYAEELVQHICKYSMLTKSRVDRLEEEVFHIVEGEYGEIKFQASLGYYTLLETPPTIKELTEQEYTLFRLENNIPVQGIDFDKPMFLDLGLYDAISFTKGCFVGQEVMARVHNLSKPAKKLVRLLYDHIPEKVTIGGEEVGKVTSSAFSEKYNKYICFAVIRKYEEKIDSAEFL